MKCCACCNLCQVWDYDRYACLADGSDVREITDDPHTACCPWWVSDGVNYDSEDESEVA